MSRLGEVKGYRGFGKLLKEITNTGKYALSKSEDDFLGLVKIPLQVLITIN